VDAVASYGAALEEGTRERVPFEWATSQQALVDALAALAKRQPNAAHMEEALTPMRSAAEVFQQSNDGYWLPIAQHHVTEMEAELVELER
jgi:hypothetical protein